MLICIDYIGEKTNWVQFNATLQFSVSSIQLVDTLSEMYDDLLVVRNFGKVSAKFPFGTSVVRKEVGLLSYFLFLAQTTIRTCLKL